MGKNVCNYQPSLVRWGKPLRPCSGVAMTSNFQPSNTRNKTNNPLRETTVVTCRCISFPGSLYSPSFELRTFCLFSPPRLHPRRRGRSPAIRAHLRTFRGPPQPAPWRISCLCRTSWVSLCRYRGNSSTAYNSTWARCPMNLLSGYVLYSRPSTSSGVTHRGRCPT